MADWSMLPSDILGDIALRLDFVEDFIFFSCVCRSWHRVYVMVKKTWNLKTTLPWLFLSESTEDNPNHYRNLFCPINKRCYQLKIPETFGTRCWGSSSGWVVTFSLNLEFNLFNPFTRAQLTLPSPSTMPFYEEYSQRSFHSQRQLFIDKMLVFTYDDDCIVFAIHGGYSMYLAFARPGDEAWTPLLRKEVRYIMGKMRVGAQDVVQHGSQFFFIFDDGVLGCCDVSALRDISQRPITIMQYLPRPLEIFDELSGFFRLYLIESFGDLIMVSRHKDEGIDTTNDKGFCYETIDFDVHKLNFGTKTWEEVEDLGDVALFVGNNFSMAIRASSYRNCKRNCIYFTDDEWQFWGETKLFGGDDMGLYNLESSDIERVYEGSDVHSTFCAPLWFIPKFF